MPANFTNTLRSLDRPPTSTLWVCPAFVLLLMWAAWMREARLSIYTSTQRARVEVASAPSRVASEAGGRVRDVDLHLGRWVEKGTVLLRLDAAAAEAHLAEQRARLEVLLAKRETLVAQRSAEEKQRLSRRRLNELVAERAIVGLERAEAHVVHQEQLSGMAEELQRQRLNSRVEVVKAEVELAEGRFAVAGARTDVERLGAERSYQEDIEAARLASAGRQIVELDAERSAVEAAIEAARVALSRLQIAAPVSGRVGHVVPLQRGDVVVPGQVVATLVPSAEVRIVAQFRPERAVGVVQPGQAARIRIDGYSWLTFGTLAAQVTHAATEPEAGWVRVELSLRGPPHGAAANIPLQHGLTASIDVETERLSPWALLRRSVGADLSRRLGAEPGVSESALASEGEP